MSNSNSSDNAPSNADRYKTLVSNLVLIVLAPITAKYVSDAATQQTLNAEVSAVVLALINLVPLVYELARKPSAAAMAVAVQADKVMAQTGPTQVTVPTGPGKPDITVKAA